MGMAAKSNGPSFSPISLNAGHTGDVSGSSPSRTLLYPVSPPKYAFFPEAGSSSAHEAQRVCHRSNMPRFAVCCAGVQVSLNETGVGVEGTEVELSEEASVNETVRESHQSMVWMWDSATPREER